MQRLVIGITGPNASGKGEIIKYLIEKKDFYSISLSDILRKKAQTYNIPLTRDNLINLGNNLRKKYGCGILAKWAIKEILKSSSHSIVVDSIRNLEEIREFKKKFKDNFYLIYVTAPKRLRFNFMLMRNREGDPKTYKEFLEVERKENSKKSYQQQISKCKELKDFLINNNSTLENLHRKVDKILDRIYARYEKT